MNYQGIDIGWWVIIPRNAEPISIEAALGKINLHVSVKPSGEFRKSLTERQIDSLETGWNVAIASPQRGAVSTVEEIAKSVYDELVALHGIRLRNLVFYDDDHHAETNTNIMNISSDEYVKNIVRDVKWEYSHAIKSQIDKQSVPKK